MKSESAELASIVDDLKLFLEKTDENLLLHTDDEIHPVKLDFIFHPVLSHASNLNDETFNRTAAVPSEGMDILKHHFKPASSLTSKNKKHSGEEQNQATPVIGAGTPDNALCNECSDRIFYVKKYKRKGKIPLLVLYYCGQKNDKSARVDKGDRHIFGTPEEDDLFERMSTVAGLSSSSFYYQEYPACRFNPARSTDGDWIQRSEKCLKFRLVPTLVKENIKLILVTGFAAQLLFGEEKAHELAESGELLPVEYGSVKVNTLVIRSPEALLRLEKKRNNIKKQSSTESKEYKDIRAKENLLKRRILETLKHAIKISGT